MKVLNQMKLEFMSRSTNESFARVAVAAFITQLDPTLEELSDIKTAVSEAVTNAIVHGYRYEEGIVKLQCKIYDNHSVEIIVKDRGTGIPDVQQALVPLFTTQPEMERSGMGFSIMESFMDKIRVTSKVGQGTTVKMLKKLA